MIARGPGGFGAIRGGWLLLVLACRGGDAGDGARRPARPPEVASAASRASTTLPATSPAQTDSPGRAASTAPRALQAPSAAPRSLALTPFSRGQVCATLGALRPSANGLFLIEDPKLRATLAGSRGHGVELVFRYFGPTALNAKLRSGRDRRQLGLELLARDTCNLLYVMWRLEPTSELVVSVKRNGAQSTHAECENRGYQRLRPSVSSPLPELVPGTEHRLRAEIARGTLSVHLDDSSIWSGTLDAATLELSGKSGLRSDNARLEVLALRADAPEGPPPGCDAARN